MDLSKGYCNGQLSDQVIFYECEDNLNTTIVEMVKQDGSDSGVELNGKWREAQHSCSSSVVSGHSSSPSYGADIDDLVASTNNLHISLENVCSVSENGSESSSVGSNSKCRPSCITPFKRNITRRSIPVAARKSGSPNVSHVPIVSKQNRTNNYLAPTISSRAYKVSDKISTRSLSSTRHSTDTNKCDGTSNVTSLANSDKSTIDKYATIPRRRRKTLDNNNSDGKGALDREPSLNRAASLRKKFVENNSMTNSMTSSINSKVMPPHIKRTTKTKIYHEVSTQTSLTSCDLSPTNPTASFKKREKMEDAAVQVENEEELSKIMQEQTKLWKEELKKAKTENEKQKNVIEWLEGELAQNKEEKNKLHKQLNDQEYKITMLLNHKDTSQHPLRQLEREVTCSSKIISQQQEEITELQHMCGVLKKDLEKSYATQKFILDSHRINEVESIELQEFLQAEKSLLSDSLKDAEQDIRLLKETLATRDNELLNKTEECSHLVRMSQQHRQEKKAAELKLIALEHRTRELLLHQGAVVSSASLALSGVTSRFEMLLERLIVAYKLLAADLEDGVYHNEAYSCSSEDSRDSGTQSSPVHSDMQEESVSSSSHGFFSELLSAIRNTTSQSSFRYRPDNSNSSSDEVRDGENACDRSRDDMVDGISISSCRCSSLSRCSSILNDEYPLPVKRSSLPNALTDDSFDKSEFTMTDSLSNLSEAIMTRKNVERICDDSLLKESSSQDVSLLDQVIEVDNVVTKLLKAIRIIQLSYCQKENSNSAKTEGATDDDPLSSEEIGFIRQVRNDDIKITVNDFENWSDIVEQIRKHYYTVDCVLNKLQEIQDTVNQSDILKHIQLELETANFQFVTVLPFLSQSSDN